MSTQEFNTAVAVFNYDVHRDDAQQRVFEALSAFDLVGYIEAADRESGSTYVHAELALNEDEQPMTASASGNLSVSQQSLEQLAGKLVEASGADRLYLDGDLAAGTELEHPEDAGADDEKEMGVDAEESLQAIAGPSLRRSDLVLSAMGQPGSWLVRQDASALLALRRGEPVEIILGRKMVPALEILRHDEAYELRFHARRGAVNVNGSVAAQYWMGPAQRAVPTVAAGSAAAKYQADLAQWLYGIDEEELAALESLWPQAARELRALSNERTEESLRQLVGNLGMPSELIDAVRDELDPTGFETLKGGLFTGLDQALEEEISDAKGVKRLIYRTGWSPSALIGSSLLILAAGTQLNRWMRRKAKPGAGWRRTIMFFWYSDAIYYLARGFRQVLAKRLPKA